MIRCQVRQYETERRIGLASLHEDSQENLSFSPHVLRLLEAVILRDNSKVTMVSCCINLIIVTLFFQKVVLRQFSTAETRKHQNT